MGELQLGKLKDQSQLSLTDEYGEFDDCRLFLGGECGGGRAIVIHAVDGVDGECCERRCWEPAACTREAAALGAAALGDACLAQNGGGGLIGRAGAEGGGWGVGDWGWQTGSVASCGLIGKRADCNCE